MAEKTDVQEAKACCCGGVGAKGAFKIILGLILITLGIWAVITWFPDLLAVIKGCVGVFLFLAGVVFIILARE